MGSENSKSNKKSEIGNEALRFGPTGTQEVRQPATFALNQHQIVDPLNEVQRISHNPPAYSQIDPLPANQRCSTVPNPIVVSQTIYRSNAPPIPQRTMISSQNLTSTVNQNDTKTGNNAQNKMTKVDAHPLQSNPYVWMSDGSVASAQVKNQQQNVNKSKASVNVTNPMLPTIPNRSSTGQSPSYDPIKNPYVWKNETSKMPTSITVDFEKELPQIKKNMLNDKNEAAVNIMKELNKNKSLSEVRKLLVNNEYLSDIRIILNSKIYFGHKLFLVTASSLFYQHFQVNGYNEAILDEYGIDEESLLTILAFCYTGILPKLTDDNVLSIFHAADKLKVCQAFTTCCSYIYGKINSDGVFVVFEKAIELSNELFQKRCLDYIKKNEDKCFNSDGFFKISLTSLITILGKCDYPSEKSNGIIEKWNNGPIAPSNLTSSNDSEPTQNSTGAKKKDNQQQQNRQKNPQQQQLIQPNKNQQQAVKNQKKNGNQKPKGNQNQNQQNKKQATNMPKIPSIVDLDIPPPPFAEGFQLSNIHRIDSISNLSDDLITFEDDNASNNDMNDLVCVENDESGRTKVVVRGIESSVMTELSRIDFIAKRSFLLHEVWFNENMFKNCSEVRVSISIFEAEKRSDVHSRTIKRGSGNRLNFIKFSRQPLKIFIGQKFFIKLNFAEKAMRKHIDPQSLSTIDFMELRKDAEVRKYFNCISKLILSEMT